MNHTLDQNAGQLSAIPRTQFWIIVFALTAAVLFIAELSLGPVSIPPSRIVAVLQGEGSVAETAILWQIRVPRALLGVATGAALALAGAALQGLLRNPLAEPGLIGVTAGASLGAVSVIVLGSGLGALLPAMLMPFLLPIAAFLGGALVITVLFTITARSRGPMIATLILTGVALNAIAAAGIGVLVYISDDQQLRDLTFWTMGALGTAESRLVAIVVLLVALTLPIFFAQARKFDMLQLGERAAFHSGLNVGRSRRLIAIAIALSVGAVTSAAGPIGFIGLVAPHLARLLVGPEHRMLLPASALMGISLILAADLAVRLAVPPAEPPIGLATSLIGGPFFLWLLMRQASKGRILA